MTDRCLECVELLRLAAGKLREAATEGPESARWTAELDGTARALEVIGEKIRRWLVGPRN